MYRSPKIFFDWYTTTVLRDSLAQTDTVKRTLYPTCSKLRKVQSTNTKKAARESWRVYVHNHTS